jgi:hypothetical protein
VGAVTGREQLIAYLSTLGALVVVFIAALIAAGRGVTVGEAFGLGTITGGLIGILRIPAQRQVEVTNPPSDPIPVEPTRT